MIDSPHRHNRERLGWVFLLIGFVVFVAIAITVPLSVSAYLQNTTQPLPTSVQANQGTVRIDDQTDVMRVTLAGEPAESIESGAVILTDATAKALVFVYPPNSEQVLARMQVYGNSNLRLDRADAPRFQVSAAEPRLALALENGRLQLYLPEIPDLSTMTQVVVKAPQAMIVLHEPGQYSFEVTNTMTQVAVRDGLATVEASSSSLELLPDQRAMVANDQPPQGPLDTERNLIRNGDFSDSFDQWTLFTWNVELADQPEGLTQVRSVDGEPTLTVIREGEGHADVRVRQAINQDVTDYESLQLFLTFRIMDQDLAVCGIRGSECPLFVRINYIDDSGISRTWQHGFYSTGEIVAGATPDACVSCDVVQSSHQMVQLSQVYFYEVEMRADLARQGYLPPRIIESISLVASGHSFSVEVMDLALMARE
jgi:hypothetical protein